VFNGVSVSKHQFSSINLLGYPHGFEFAKLDFSLQNRVFLISSLTFHSFPWRYISMILISGHGGESLGCVQTPLQRNQG